MCIVFKNTSLAVIIKELLFKITSEQPDGNLRKIDFDVFATISYYTLSWSITHHFTSTSTAQ